MWFLSLMPFFYRPWAFAYRSPSTSVGGSVMQLMGLLIWVALTKNNLWFFSSQLTSIAASSRVSANKQEGKPGVFPSKSNSADDDSNHTRSVTIDKFVLCKESNRIVPSVEIARLLPLSVREASNEVLLILAAQGNHEACAEVLTRHIMSHDDVGYTEAEIKLKVIRRAHRNAMKPSAYFHFAVGSVDAIAGVASFPMVFDINTVSFLTNILWLMIYPLKKHCRLRWKWALGHGLGWSLLWDNWAFSSYAYNLLTPSTTTLDYTIFTILAKCVWQKPLRSNSLSIMRRFWSISAKKISCIRSEYLTLKLFSYYT